MGSVSRPTYVEYTVAGKTRLPDGTRVTRDTPGAVARTGTSPYYRAEWTDANGVRRRKALRTRSKATALKMLAALENEQRLAAMGIRPDDGQRSRPLAEHLDDYRRHLTAKGDVQAHVAETVRQVAAVLEGCRFMLAADVDPDAVAEYLHALRQPAQAPALDQETYTAAEAATVAGIDTASVSYAVRRGALRGVWHVPQRGHAGYRIAATDLAAWLAARPTARGASVETSNHYLRAVKGFTRWLKRRVGADQLDHLQALNTETDRRRERRSLPSADLARLLDAAAAGEPAWNLTGPARRLLYHLAVRTGLRAGELASLTPRSLDLDARPPTVTVQAGYSKRRRLDVLPLRADLAAELREYAAGREPGEPLWPGSWADNAADMLRLDLAAAGVAFRDERGQVADFHALRHTFLTHLMESGVHPKTAQVLARHSSIVLTLDRYSHLAAVDVAADLDRLPALPCARLGGPAELLG